MAAAGLSTPLHLAASLLAFAVGVGLAVLVVVRPGTLPSAARRDRPLDLVLACGGILIAVGHGLEGALVPRSGTVVAWLHAAGLVLMAIGLSPRRLAELTADLHPSSALRRLGPAVVVPGVVVPIADVPSAALVALVAGAAGGLRGLIGGRRTLLIGVGLLAWGAAGPMTAISATGDAILTVVGAAAIGVWLWEASARGLLAKFVTASVAILLAVVLLIAGVLAGVGARDLVESELTRLRGLSVNVGQTIDDEWPSEALRAADVLSGSGAAVIANVTKPKADVGEFFDTFFNEQDFFLLLDHKGKLLRAYEPPDQRVLRDSFVLQLLGSPLVDQLFEDNSATGQALLTIGGRFVAVGGAALQGDDRRPEAPPVGAVITGRVADDGWAARRAEELKTGIVVTVGGRSTVASPELRDVADEVVASLRSGISAAAVTLNGQPYYLAAAPISNRELNAVVGRAVAITPAAGLASVEQGQARGLFLLALVGALGAGALAALVTRRLVAPIRRLTEAAEAVREGDMTVAPPASSADEVGVLERTFGEMTSSMAAQSAKLREAANVEGRLRARLEALTRSMSDALVAVDPDGRIATFNPAAERLVGRKVHEVLGHPLGKVLVGHAPGGLTVMQALGASDSEQEVAVQVLLQRSDGRLVPTAATAAPVHDVDGQFLGRVLVLRDVTRETEIERMKTEFLSNVSHELRTPLTPIKGYAEVLARRQVGEEATRRFADQILSSTGRLERIVGMIVDFAALDSGRLRLRREAVVLSDLVAEVLDDWRARQPDREFRRRIGRTLPPVVADRTMLRRCLDELIDNAVKFSPGGEPVLLHAAVDAEGGRRVVRLTVRDRGVGIDDETLARVFHDFYQADASETRHYGGLGLGLALVQRIVNGLDGEVVAESDPGRGSAFSLVLPVADAASGGNGRHPDD